MDGERRRVGGIRLWLRCGTTLPHSLSSALPGRHWPWQGRTRSDSGGPVEPALSGPRPAHPAGEKKSLTYFPVIVRDNNFNLIAVPKL